MDSHVGRFDFAIFVAASARPVLAEEPGDAGRATPQTPAARPQRRR